MKLKLKQIEFLALYGILMKLTSKEACADMDDKLLHVLLTSIYIKLHRISIIRKPKYSIKMTEAEAMGFWISFNRHNLPHESFEGNLITTICNSIHQKFS